MSNQHTSPTWTEARLTELEYLWRTTDLSAKAIAEKMNLVSRNAAIGKLHRMGLSMKDRPSQEGASLETILRQRRAQALKEAGARERHAAKLALRRQRWAEKNGKPEPVPYIVQRIERHALERAQMAPDSLNPESATEYRPGQRPLLSLAKGECRWPSGHGTVAEPFTFCGATQAEASSYCPRHSDRSLWGRMSGQFKNYCQNSNLQ